MRNVVIRRYDEIIVHATHLVLYMKNTASKLIHWPEVTFAQEEQETRGTPVRTSFDFHHTRRVHPLTKAISHPPKDVPCRQRCDEH
jgi:hypothetical protein